ncbi:hypothetical protein FRC00_009712, partial [Tulasnella sp. 408]
MQTSTNGIECVESTPNGQPIRMDLDQHNNRDNAQVPPPGSTLPQAFIDEVALDKKLSV